MELRDEKNKMKTVDVLSQHWFIYIAFLLLGTQAAYNDLCTWIDGLRAFLSLNLKKKKKDKVKKTLTIIPVSKQTPFPQYVLGTMSP